MLIEPSISAIDRLNIQSKLQRQRQGLHDDNVICIIQRKTSERNIKYYPEYTFQSSSDIVTSHDVIVTSHYCHILGS